MNCTIHNQPLEKFCETCHELICECCTVHRHKDHTYGNVTEVLPNHRQQIESSLQQMTEKIEDTDNALEALRRREREVANQRDITDEEIRLYARHIVDSVQDYESFVRQVVDASVQHKLRLLRKQVQEVEAVLEELNGCRRSIEDGLEGSPQQILSEKQRMMQDMGVASEKVKPGAFQPVERADVIFAKNKVFEEDFGKVMCSFSHLPSKPKKVITGLKLPRCVAVNSEGVVVVGGEGDECVTVVDGDGGIVRSFRVDGERNGPYRICSGIAFTNDGHIVVSDGLNHRLNKLTLQGKRIMSVGDRGNGPLQFNWHTGIAVHPTTGMMYVADEYNSRVQVINEGFNHAEIFGNQEMAAVGHRQLQCPTYAALDSAGNVYICDRASTIIKVFTPDGTLIRQFGSRGSGEGELGEIWSIAVDRHDLIYVPDRGNNRISIFTSDGQFIKNFGSKGSDEGQFNSPSDIKIDVLGNLYIADTDNNRLVIY